MSKSIKELCEDAKTKVITRDGKIIFNVGLSFPQLAYYPEEESHHIRLIDGTDYSFKSFKQAAIYAVAFRSCPEAKEKELYEYVCGVQ